MKWIALFLGAFLLLFEKGMAQTTPSPQKTSKTETIYIPTDASPPSSVEDPSQPFFAVPPEYEVNEEFKDLKERVEDLKKRVEKLEKHQESQAIEKNIKQ